MNEGAEHNVEDFLVHQSEIPRILPRYLESPDIGRCDLGRLSNLSFPMSDIRHPKSENWWLVLNVRYLVSRNCCKTSDPRL